MAFCSKCGAYIAEGCDCCPACGYGGSGAQEKEKKTRERKTDHTASAASAAQEAPRQEEKRAGTGDTRQTGEYHYNYNYSYDYGKTGGNGSGSTQGSYDARPNKNPYSSSYRRSYGSAGDERRRDMNSGREFYADPYDARKNRSLSYLCYLGPLFLVPYFLCPDSEFARFHCNQGMLIMLFSIVTHAISVLPVLGWLVGAVGWVMTVVMFVNGLSNVGKGRMKELPIIGKIRLIK